MSSLEVAFRNRLGITFGVAKTSMAENGQSQRSRYESEHERDRRERLRASRIGVFWDFTLMFNVLSITAKSVAGPSF